ncbi:MAG: COX15/CtaA family protein [Dehalococcoidia bacterium]
MPERPQAFAMTFAQRLAVATALATLVLVAVGVLVRATGSGLGCPDWPTCHGGAVPPGHKHAIIEFSHRFVAMLVGFMVIGVAVCAWKFYRHVPFIVWLATATVPLVGIQGLLGALTVVRELPPEVVATHLLTAMVVLLCEISVAVAMFVEDPRRSDSSAERTAARPIGRLAIVAMLWLAAVVWIGGYMTESGAATACSGWPLCNGSALPAADDHEVVHMVHRYLAGAFVFLIVPLVLAAWRNRTEVRWAGAVAVALGVLYAVQVLVGALNVWYTFPDPLTISHTVIATLIWFTLAGAVALSFYGPAVAAQPSPLKKAGAAA